MYRLDIQHLSKSYGGGVQALHGVNLRVPNGMFGLLGPNGAGKSTLMRILATLQEPDSGQVLFDGNNIHEHPHALRSRLGYLPQDFGVYPRTSALQLLDHLAILKGLRIGKQRKEQVLALLQQTNLYEARHRAVSTFSGGMRQRFGIAQALLGNPSLIIADEPTAGLDPEERNRFHGLLSEIGEQVVVLLSTHIVEDVQDLCPQMAVLAGGRVILQGRPTLLAADLNGRVWRKTVTKAALEHYRRTLPVISTRMTGGLLQLYVLGDDCPGDGFEAFYPGLEEVYFSALFGAQRAGKEVGVC